MSSIKKGDFGADNASKVNVDTLLAPALAGHDVGLVSEAGMPAVADPGALVVRAAHKLGGARVRAVWPLIIGDGAGCQRHERAELLRL